MSQSKDDLNALLSSIRDLVKANLQHSYRPYIAMSSVTKTNLEHLSHKIDVEDWELEAANSKPFSVTPPPSIIAPKLENIFGIKIAVDDRLADSEFQFVTYEATNELLPMDETVK